MIFSIITMAEEEEEEEEESQRNKKANKFKLTTVSFFLMLSSLC